MTRLFPYLDEGNEDQGAPLDMMFGPEAHDLRASFVTEHMKKTFGVSSVCIICSDRCEFDEYACETCKTCGGTICTLCIQETESMVEEHRSGRCMQQFKEEGKHFKKPSAQQRERRLSAPS